MVLHATLAHRQLDGCEGAEHHRLVEIAEMANPEHLAGERSKPLAERQVIAFQCNPAQFIGVKPGRCQDRRYGIGNPGRVGAQQLDCCNRAGQFAIHDTHTARGIAAPVADRGADGTGEPGMAIKDGSPYEHTFVITHCNGGAGYLPPKHLYEQEGYEIRSTGFGPQAADMLVKKTLQMLSDL